MTQVAVNTERHLSFSYSMHISEIHDTCVRYWEEMKKIEIQ